MPKITINRFSGIAPKLSASILREDMAQVASNAKLSSGHLASYRDQVVVDKPAKSGPLKTIYRHPNDGSERWLHWTQEVHVVPSPIAGDTNERTYFTGTDKPRVTDSVLIDGGGNNEFPEASYLLGIPAPTTAPTTTVIGTPTGTPLDRVYVYTFVSAWGEEGPPSPVSAITTVENGETVDLTAMDAAPAGDYNITKWRIYRSLGGSGGTQLQFVAEVTINASSPQYNDSVADADLAELIPSTDWVPPPVDLIGIVAMPNGVIAGFRENEIYLCEPYQPHAWPTKYSMSVNYPIVGLGVFGNSIVVTTTSYPYLITGSDPSSMSKERLSYVQPCVSSRGIVSAASGVIYPTPDCLFYIGSGGGRSITEKLYSRNEWQAISPGTMRSAIFDGMYVGFTGIGSAIVLDYEGGDNQLTTLDIIADSVYSDPETDRLYYGRTNQSTGEEEINDFDANGGRLTYEWRSKKFQLTGKAAMTAGRVLANYGDNLSDTEKALLQAAIDAVVIANQSIITSGDDIEGAINAAAINVHRLNGDSLQDIPDFPVSLSVVVRVYGDDNLIVEYQVGSNTPFRIPANGKKQNYEIELVGKADVYEVKIATSIRDLV